MRIQVATYLMLAIVLVSCASVSATATSIPTLPAGASFTELKYQLLLQFPNLFFCDPDYYPVARADEGDLVQQVFPELEDNLEEFQAILDHKNMRGLTSFTDEQKLLIYREHKKLGAIIFEPVGSDYQFQLQIEENQGQGFIIKGLIDLNGLVTVQQHTPSITICPICLAAHTQIDTPGGPVAVENLRVGDAIWTSDTTGMRSAAIILKTMRVLVPSDHQMVHIILSDGRELRASPGHPTMDGRVMRDLQLGDLLDGARITHLEYTAYDQAMTYDVLPSGGTGFYWANGVLIGSTLVSH